MRGRSPRTSVPLHLKCGRNRPRVNHGIALVEYCQPRDFRRRSGRGSAEFRTSPNQIERVIPSFDLPFLRQRLDGDVLGHMFFEWTGLRGDVEVTVSPLVFHAERHLHLELDRLQVRKSS